MRLTDPTNRWRCSICGEWGQCGGHNFTRIFAALKRIRDFRESQRDRAKTPD